MADGWKTLSVVCKGGLNESQPDIILGQEMTGYATVLQNYEESVEGGYERIKGYTEYGSSAVPGEGPVLGVKVAKDGVYAVRKSSVADDNNLYFCTGGSWSAALNTTTRPGAVTKARMISYAIGSTEKIALVDGINHAATYDGTTYTVLNGTNAPSDPKYLAFHLDRLVLAGYSSNPNAFIISAPSDDTDWTAVGGAWEAVLPDEIVGIKKHRNVLYFFCENSIYKLSGTSDSNFVIDDVTSSIGCVSGDTIQEIAGDLVFLAPDGIRSLAATERVSDVELGLVSDTIKPSLTAKIGNTQANYFSSCLVRKKSQYRLFIYDVVTDLTKGYGDAGAIYGGAHYGETSDDNLAPGFLGVARTGEFGAAGQRAFSWSTLVGINAWTADSAYQNDDELVVFGHPTTGFVYQLEDGTSFNGAAIEFIYKTPNWTFGNNTLRKVFQKMQLNTSVDGNLEFTLQPEIDFGSINVKQPNPITLTATTDLSSYGSALYGTDVYSILSEKPIFKKNLIGSGFTLALIFTGSSTEPTHRIDSIQIEYAQKDKR